jgi:hypothetical protein
MVICVIRRGGKGLWCSWILRDECNCCSALTEACAGHVSRIYTEYILLRSSSNIYFIRSNYLTNGGE